MRRAPIGRAGGDDAIGEINQVLAGQGVYVRNVEQHCGENTMLSNCPVNVGFLVVSEMCADFRTLPFFEPQAADSAGVTLGVTFYLAKCRRAIWRPGHVD